MSEVKWIKITTGIFDDEKILLIESLPDSYAIITCWFKLLCLAGKQNNSGVFLMGRIAYTDKMLATIFRMKETTVTLALQTFEQFGMIEIVDGVITIPNWEKHQSLDKLEHAREQTRIRVARHRDKQKQLASGNASCNAPCNDDVTQADKEEDIEGDIEGEEENNKPGKRAGKKPVKHKHGEFQNVLLTDAEFEKLGEDYGIPLRDQAISFFDAYIEEKGYKSKSHNLALRRWVIDAVNSRGNQNPQPINRPSYQKQSKAEELDEFYKMAGAWANQ